MGLRISKTPKRRKNLHAAFVIIPKRATTKQKVMLADFIKAQPLTTDPKIAKKFAGRNGAHAFLKKHPTLRRRMKYTALTTFGKELAAAK